MCRASYSSDPKTRDPHPELPRVLTEAAHDRHGLLVATGSVPVTDPLVRRAPAVESCEPLSGPPRNQSVFYCVTGSSSNELSEPTWTSTRE
jgi:hypothetical protein